MKLSVIIPIHNRARTIARTLLSLPDSYRQDYEIIVSDDASTDDSVSIVESLRIPNLKVVRSLVKTNGNAARNGGLRASSGEIIAFLDSDDEFAPARIPGLVAYFQSNPEVEVIMGNFSTELNGILRGFQFKETKISKQLLHEALVCHAIPITFSSIAVRKSSFSKLGTLDEMVERHQDRDFILSALASDFNISLQNSDDVVKHQSADSFSRSGIGYMRALEVLARKHDLFHSDTQVLVKEYLVLRSLLHSFAGLKLSEFAGNLREFWSAPTLNRHRTLRVWSYFSGKKVRRRMERQLVKHCACSAFTGAHKKCRNAPNA